MKKYCILLSILLLLVVSGCGNNNEKEIKSLSENISQAESSGKDIDYAKWLVKAINYQDKVLLQGKTDYKSNVGDPPSNDESGDLELSQLFVKTFDLAMDYQNTRIAILGYQTKRTSKSEMEKTLADYKKDYVKDRAKYIKALKAYLKKK